MPFVICEQLCQLPFVNNTSGWTSFRLFVRDAGSPEGEIFYRRIVTGSEGHTLEEEVCPPVKDGYLSFDLPPFSAVIYANEPAPEASASNNSPLISKASFPS